MRSLLARLALASILAAPTMSPLGCDKPAPSGGGAASGAPAADGKITIIANDDGFKPSEVKLAKGKASTLVFKRTSDGTCATEVEFPELKLKKDLPLNQEVAIEIPAGEARTLGFQCGMGMYKSKVVIQ